MTMDFNLEEYSPIDYRKWILGKKTGQGVNIKRLRILREDELRVWDFAVPYQDQRDDSGQAEIVTYFAIEFLKYLKGDRRVVIPTAILHDVGWWGGDAESWKELVKSSGEKGVAAILTSTDAEEQRRPHQNRGNLIAGRILERATWPERYSNEIADIIGDHDTRKFPPTKNGKIVWASDFMWRVSYPHLQIYRKDASANRILEIGEGTALYCSPPRDLQSIELEIARIEMVNTLFFKFGDNVRPILEPKYRKELEKIIQFYNVKSSERS